jgi:integrase
MSADFNTAETTTKALGHGGLTPAPTTTRSRGKSSKKTAKPDQDFPLWLHPSGRWCRKFKGKVYYFGRERQAALDLWIEQKDNIFSGRGIVRKTEGLLIGDPPNDPDSAVGLVNRFLSSKQQLLEAGELTARTFADYKGTCQRLVDVFGWSRRVDDLTPDDFESLRAQISKTRGVVSLGNEINKVKIILKYAADNRLIPLAVNYGSNFKRPSQKTLRVHRAQRGKRIFEADEIRKLLKSASVPMTAMILLGINAGFGQSDISKLPKSAINFETGWIHFPRPKTGIDRRVRMWPETAKAIIAAIEARPDPKDPADAELAFITKYGHPWTRLRDTGAVVCAISQEFSKLLKEVGINGHRKFYSLRRGFETIAGDSRDQIATDFIMGHVPSARDMSAVYRDRIEDERLKAVVEHVRRWLFPKRKPTSRI